MKNNDIQRSIDAILSGVTVSEARKAELLQTVLNHGAARSAPAKPPKLKLRFSLSLPLPHMVVAAIVVVIVMVAPMFLPEQSVDFETWHSDDGEHYMVYRQGKEQNQQIAEADSIPTEYGMFNCTTLEEVKQCYGTIPPMPTWLPEGLTWLSYNVGATTHGRNFTAIYLQGEGTIVYTVLENYEGLYYTAVEQSEEGEYITLASGQEVYITKNIDHLSLFWTANDVELMISGAFTREEAIRMAESVQ